MLAATTEYTMASQEASDSLYSCKDLQLWSSSYHCYKIVIGEMSARRSKKKSKTNNETESLLDLDTWYQQELPVLISSRAEPYLKHEEVCRLMKWKLVRGKFRPRLTELIRANSAKSVEEITKMGFSLLPRVEAAIQHVSQLKGVGPATASAILCAAAPDRVAFMADESVLSVPGLGKLEYNLRHYLSFLEKIKEKVKELNNLGKRAGDGVKTHWTVHDVELALWAHHNAKKLKPELLERQQNPVSCRDKRTSLAVDGSDSSGSEDTGTKPKRLKLS